LVREQLGSLDAGIGDAQVPAGDEAGEQRARGRVGERLPRAEHEQGDQHERDADCPARDHHDERNQHERPAQVDEYDHSPAVEPVCRDPADHAEQEDRQVLAQERHRDKERVAGEGGDEQRTGRDDDPIADPVGDRRRQQPAELSPEPGRSDGLGESGGQSHRPKNSNRQSRPASVS